MDNIDHLILIHISILYQYNIILYIYNISILNQYWYSRHGGWKHTKSPVQCRGEPSRQSGSNGSRSASQVLKIVPHAQNSDQELRKRQAVSKGHERERTKQK
jgi:hypothetical protein